MSTMIQLERNPAAELRLEAGLCWTKTLSRFVGGSQKQVIRQNMRGEEGEWFCAKVVELSRVIESMPASYETDGQGDEAIVHLHYFTGGMDWYIVEKDAEDEQLQAFGLADLFRDGGEVGYIDLTEITRCGAELDFHWTPKTLGEVRAARNL